MSHCLTMSGVWKSYDAGVHGCSATVSVLRDVTLDVAAGELVGVVAAPASGKTTLLMCAGGMMRPDRGSIAWFGAASSRDRGPRPDGIAFAGDRPFPYGFLTVREAVEYAAIVRDLPIRDAAQRVRFSLETVGIDAIGHRRVDTLDGNALARLSIAAALLARPRLVLVDDFAPGCDADTAAELVGVLHELARNGAGIVVAGRFVARLGALSDVVTGGVRSFVLAGGRLESTTERPDVVARRLAGPVQYSRTRVAEQALPSAARENGAR